MSIPAGLRLRDTSTAASPVESALSSRAGDLLASTSLLEKDDCLQGGRFIVKILLKTRLPLKNNMVSFHRQMSNNKHENVWLPLSK